MQLVDKLLTAENLKQSKANGDMYLHN